MAHLFTSQQSHNFPGGAVVKNLTAKQKTQETEDTGSIVGQESHWEKETATPVFLSGKFHGQRSLEGYIPWGHKESNTTEHLCQ